MRILGADHAMTQSLPQTSTILDATLNSSPSHPYNTRASPHPTTVSTPSFSPPAPCTTVVKKEPTALLKTKQLGRQPGSVNFKSNDIDRLLDCVETIKPIGADMWERVENMYNSCEGSFVSDVHQPTMSIPIIITSGYTH